MNSEKRKIESTHTESLYFVSSSCCCYISWCTMPAHSRISLRIVPKEQTALLTIIDWMYHYKIFILLLVEGKYAFYIFKIISIQFFKGRRARGWVLVVVIGYFFKNVWYIASEKPSYSILRRRLFVLYYYIDSSWGY